MTFIVFSYAPICKYIKYLHEQIKDLRALRIQLNRIINSLNTFRLIEQSPFGYDNRYEYQDGTISIALGICSIWPINNSFELWINLFSNCLEIGANQFLNSKYILSCVHSNMWSNGAIKRQWKSIALWIPNYVHLKLWFIVDECSPEDAWATVLFGLTLIRTK